MDPATSVQIYLPVHGAPVSFLSIPYSDIQRLAIRPFKWIRFVMFCICGARGDLAATPNGPPVKYDSTSLDEDKYYYKPSEPYKFVDPHVLNDRITSSVATARSYTFRDEVKERDGGECVFTRTFGVHCDAAHLIPKSKSDEYIRMVFDLRSECYDSPQDPISEINDVRNGIFVNKLLHCKFGLGEIAFLKTPNFAMDSTDIPRIAQGSADDHITLHQLKPEKFDPILAQALLALAATGQADLDPTTPAELLLQATLLSVVSNPAASLGMGLNVDGLFPNPQLGELPPAIILDFLYGIAAYKLWQDASSCDEVNKYYEENYGKICARSSGDEGDSSGEYQPSPPESERRYSERDDGLASAMDQMNLAMMYFSGITPQELARRQEKRIEEEEMVACESSRSKVAEWMKTVDCD